MRFTENGPAIPNELLDARDAGEVVFLCGAGISIPAGLPDFLTLTERVATLLGVSPDSELGSLIAAARRSQAESIGRIEREAISLDRVFSQIVNAFGVAQVESEVAAALTIAGRSKLANHRAILDLARGPDGRQRLVTTNFDTLFKRAQRRLRTYVPPHLPDLIQRGAFDGLVHLHGLLPDAAESRSDASAGLILTSGDFGRAYLADAWATRFICGLLDRHIVVLLGYSADDPPVRYLLEGLNAAGRISARRLYAFVAGDAEIVERSWRDRGVTPIAYDPANRHRHLWESIHAWAGRARSPVDWRKLVVDLANTAPTGLKSFERGQVASLCSSLEGSQAFAAAKPPPPAEWLCVFDAACRYANPGRRFSPGTESNSDVDPLVIYGLDDDPPRPEREQAGQALPGLNVLAPLGTDNPVAREVGLTGNVRGNSAQLSPRLFELLRWTHAVMSSPTTAWWAAKSYGLHPNLHNQFSWSLYHSNEQFDPVVRRAWQLLLEANRAPLESALDGWHQVRAEVLKDGWSPRSIRTFAEATRPRIVIGRSLSVGPMPPAADQPPSLQTIARFEVRYPKLLEKVEDVPAEKLGLIVEVIRRALKLGIELETEVTRVGFRIPTLHPAEKPGTHHHSDSEAYYLTLARLFSRLAKADRNSAYKEFCKWDGSIAVFKHLQVWAALDPKMVSGAEVGRILRSLDRDAFWRSDFAREILWTLRARWKDLSNRDRLAVEVKMIAGRKRHSSEAKSEYNQNRISLSLDRLVWMRNEKLKLSMPTRARLIALKKKSPEWKAARAKAADQSFESRVAWVKQETNPAPIAGLPISKILAQCDELSKREFMTFTNRDPFRGLVEAAPRRALTVLNFHARQKKYPKIYWSRLLSSWPSTAKPAYSLALARSLAVFPATEISGVCIELCRWLETYYSQVRQLDRRVANQCFDNVLDALEAGHLELLKSGIGKSSVGGVEIPSNRMGVEYAINAPTGTLAGGLLESLWSTKPKAKQKLTREFRSRFDRLLALPGEGGWHAATAMAEYLQNLYAIDRNWTKKALLPLFAPDLPAAEAAWSGFLQAGHLASPTLFRALKSEFIKAMASTREWRDRGSSVLGEHLVLAVQPLPKRKPLLSTMEGRAALRSASAQVREKALWLIRNQATDIKLWSKNVVPFLQEVWPRERQYQTAATSHILVLMILHLKERLPAGLKLVANYLVPTSDADMVLFELSKDGDGGGAELATQYSAEVLLLLSKVIDENSARPPYGLASVLSQLVDSVPDLREDERWQRLHNLSLR